jgi:hypothetical protein
MTTAAEVEAFLDASIGGWTGRAAPMLAESPELADAGFAAAVVLGDATRVREGLARDPGLATARDERTGWTALHAACGSRWHQLEPARATGLATVAGLLLDAGADLNAVTEPRPGRRGRRVPLACAVATASTAGANEPLIRLLLGRGAVPGDSDRTRLEQDPYPLDVVTAEWRGERRRRGCADVRYVLEQQPQAAVVDVPERDQVQDPNRFVNDDGEQAAVLFVALEQGCPAELVELLLAHGADTSALGPDGRTPYRLATSLGRADVAELPLRQGATVDATDDDRFVGACLRADRALIAEGIARDASIVAYRSTRELATMAARSFTPPPMRGAPTPSGSCLTVTPRSRPPTQAGTARRSSGRSSAAAMLHAQTPRRTGSRRSRR